MSESAVLADRTVKVHAYFADPANATKSKRQAAKELGIPESTLRGILALPKPEGRTMFLRLDQITLDPRLQLRVDLNRLAVDDYTSFLIAGGKFDANPKVIQDGDTYYLWDGYQRHAAYAAASREEYEVDITPGTFRDAWLAAIGANASHGVNRTPADKRNAVNALLDDPECSQWSMARLAKTANVGEWLVSDCVKRRQEATGEARPEAVKFVRNGKEVEATPNPHNRKTESHPPARADEAGDAAVLAEVAASSEAIINGTSSYTDSHPPARADEKPHDLTSAPPSDAEWLAGLSVRKHLSDRARSIFDKDALLWRHVIGHPTTKSYGDMVKHNAALNPDVPSGSFSYIVLRPLRIQTPEAWVYCATCEGSGLVGGQDCTKCHSRGYLLK